MTMDNREEFVKKELWKFVQNQCEESAEAFHSSVDEIVLSYMVSILEELGSELSSEDAFDIDSFTEMMEAYLPGFAQIDSVQTSEWMFELAMKLSNQENNETLSTTNVTTTSTEPTEESLLSRLVGFSLSDRDKESANNAQSSSTDFSPLACRSRTNSSRTSSTSENLTALTPNSRTRTASSRQSSLSETDIQNVNGETVGGIESEGDLEDDEEVKLLLEMFPAACTMEVAHCLCVANGNLEGAAQLMLHRQESGESVQQSNSQSTKSKKKKGGTALIGDNEMKKHIIQKYSYVDTEADKKEHKPIMLKKEPKKMVRYLDGRIVSTRGERFTELKKPEDEDMKKTYVNLKPARQYRFH